MLSKKETKEELITQQTQLITQVKYITIIYNKYNKYNNNGKTNREGRGKKELLFR